jgi:hypothetical protein
LRVRAFVGVAGEVGHFAVALLIEPSLETGRAGGRGGGGETAIVKTEFAGALLDGLFHSRIGGLGKAELMKDLLADFLERAEFGVEEDVGLLVEKLAGGEELANFGKRVGLAQ